MCFLESQLILAPFKFFEAAKTVIKIVCTSLTSLGCSVSYYFYLLIFNTAFTQKKLCRRIF